MTVPHTHSCFTMASFPQENWHEAEPLLETWKSLLQALPGFLECGVWMRRLDNGDMRCVIQVGWEYREQLEEFLASRWAPEYLADELDPPPYDMVSDHFEQHI